MTIEDLIERLNKYPKDLKVVIEDADTLWLLPIVKEEVHKDLLVLFSSGYSQRLGYVWEIDNE